MAIDKKRISHSEKIVRHFPNGLVKWNELFSQIFSTATE